MNNKIISLVIIFLALISLGFIGYFTGFVTDELSLSISVDEYIKGKIIGPDHNYTIKAYYPMNGSVVFRNVGSTTFDEQIRVTIEQYNNTSNVYKTYNDIEYELIPGQERFFKFVYYTNVTGLYWIHVNVSYANTKRVHKYSLFEVVELYPSTETTTETSSGDGDADVSVETGTVNMTMEYDKEITVSRGKSVTMFLIIENTGGKSLNNIKVFGTAEFPFTVEPVMITKLSSEKVGIFLVTLNIPYNLDEGKYDFEFDVITDETKQSGSVKVNVQQLSICDEVKQLISGYKFIVQRIDGEIEKAKLDNKKVTEIVILLDKVKSELVIAEDLYSQGRCFESMDHLEIVRELLIEIVRLLALIGIPISFITMSGMISLALILLIIACVFMVLIYRKRKRKKSEQ